MRRCLPALAALVIWALPVWAEERITSFVSEVSINADASLDVTETISVVAEGAVIRHGIYRDFPTIYKGPDGRTVVVGFEVLDARIDGARVAFDDQKITGGRRVRIGSENILLVPGKRVFTLSYHTTRQLGFFADHDELYWNVTGNDWVFPIEQARVIVHLPDGGAISQSTGFTGVFGARGRDFSVLRDQGGVFEAVTTKVLQPGSGFSVVIGWQKGLVAVPTGGQRWLWFFQDNAGYWGLLVTLLGVGIYFAAAWARVGRDPPAGTIVPLFSAPDGLDPAATRFVWNEGYDAKTFAASLVGLGVKGRLKILDEDGKYALIRQPDEGGELTTAERSVYAALPAGMTELKNTNHAEIAAMQKALRRRLQVVYEGSVFNTNSAAFWIGVGLAVAGLALSALAMPLGGGIETLFPAVWLGAFMAIGLAKIGQVRRNFALVSLLGLIPVLAFFGVMMMNMVDFDGWPAGLGPVIGTGLVLILVIVLFQRLLKAPTIEGRKLMDQVEGFRMYMKTAEEDRLNVLHPPEKTPELFEKNLPYALALDCENEWNSKFAAVLAAAAVAGRAAPSWYVGQRWNSAGMGDLTDSIGRGLASSAASASQAPGSRSGFGGGGGSGGGGGGGGGGGF